MRVGQNPAKAIDQVPQPARVTLAVVCYIPFLSGYYAGSLDVLQACLQSIWENTPQPYDLLVFDNACCPEVRDYLTDMEADERIQYLILSDKNVGKGGAWNMICQGAPGEIIAYADSDVHAASARRRQGGIGGGRPGRGARHRSWPQRALAGPAR